MTADNHDVDIRDVEVCDDCGELGIAEDMAPCDLCDMLVCPNCSELHELDHDDEEHDTDDGWDLPCDRDSAAAKLAAWNARIAEWNAAQMR